MEAALEVTGVTKTFGPNRAVDELNLVVPRGATYGLIGPSGAGKTTAIRMIMSILFPDRGTARDDEIQVVDGAIRPEGFGDTGDFERGFHEHGSPDRRSAARRECR